jgi:hypothetical protein
MGSKTMAESKQKKARRLAAESFNEKFQDLNLGTATEEDLRIVLMTTAANRNWTVIMVMTGPLVMYWEVNYSRNRRLAFVKPYLPYAEFSYPDEPAPVKVKVAK